MQMEGLRKLVLSDGVAKFTVEETYGTCVCVTMLLTFSSGEVVLCATGELHMEVLLNDLREFAKCDIVAANPIVSYEVLRFLYFSRTR
jgi:translation elongation factor EF-4